MKHIIGVLAAIVTLWITSVLLIPPILAIWPHAEGGPTIPLMPQNIPGILIGFIISLYVFRRITKVSTDKTNPNA
jgi:hypothetical protein